MLHIWIRVSARISAQSLAQIKGASGECLCHFNSSIFNGTHLRGHNWSIAPEKKKKKSFAINSIFLILYSSTLSHNVAIPVTNLLSQIPSFFISFFINHQHPAANFMPKYSWLQLLKQSRKFKKINNWKWLNIAWNYELNKLVLRSQEGGLSSNLILHLIFTLTPLISKVWLVQVSCCKVSCNAKTFIAYFS